jgi:hypothetical protein
LSRYPEEEAKNSQKVTVQGRGNALKIHSSGYDDLIYAGSGTSTFDQFSTDAEVVFVREAGDIKEITLLDGSYLKYQNTQWIGLSKRADYVTVKNDGEVVDYHIQGDTDLSGELFAKPLDPSKIQARDSSRNQNDRINNNKGNQQGGTGNSGSSFDPISFFIKITEKIRDYIVSVIT